MRRPVRGSQGERNILLVPLPQATLRASLISFPLSQGVAMRKTRVYQLKLPVQHQLDASGCMTDYFGEQGSVGKTLLSQLVPETLGTQVSDPNANTAGREVHCSNLLIKR